MMHHRRKLSAPTRGLQSPAITALVTFLAGTAACGAGDADHRAEPAAAQTGQMPAPATSVALGADVLFRDSLHLVRNRRVGLITNHTGLSWPGDSAVSTIDRLASAPGVELVALYSPEHGIRGRAEAGEAVASDVDPATGVPIHSLYGETRRPTPAMLEGVDVLLFDIQDIGTRYYTYVWTMALAMDAAGEAGIPFVVLDRPNPLGGRLVHGNVLDTAFATFVGLYPVPMRHGLTAGELARLLVAEHGVDVELTVVPMDGWSRDLWYDDTGLPFIPPSPNMPSLASATHYPGTCLFEGTNLSVGRGTDRAFQQIGAPWLDADGIARDLNDGAHPGVRFEAVTFTPESPGDGKFGETPVAGLRFVVTDREVYDPVRAAIGALLAIRRAHPDSVTWRVDHFDRLAGTDRLRTLILRDAGIDEITAPWASQREQFAATVDGLRLYR
jgi:uncharacterized protein YbbC (DUF1343 family)